MAWWSSPRRSRRHLHAGFDPSDLAELEAAFAAVEAEQVRGQVVQAAPVLRRLVSRRVPARAVEPVPERRAVRVRFADGTQLFVRGRTPGDAGVLASVVRQYRVLPADYRTDDAGTHLVFDWFDGRRHMSLLVTGLDQPD